MGIFPQPLVLGWMGPSVDQMANEVITAREVNVSRVKTAPTAPTAPAPARARADAGSPAGSNGRLLAAVPGAPAENPAK